MPAPISPALIALILIVVVALAIPAQGWLLRRERRAARIDRRLGLR